MKKSKIKIMNFNDFLNSLQSHPSYVSKNSLFSIIERFRYYKPVVQLCKILKVSRGGYYKWLKRQEKENPNKEIIETIFEIQKKHNFNLGHRRVKIELEKLDIIISDTTTYRIMKNTK